MKLCHVSTNKFYFALLDLERVRFVSGLISTIVPWYVVFWGNMSVTSFVVYRSRNLAYDAKQLTEV